MPLPMIHLSVAVKMNLPEEMKCPAFFLGAISPDAVHMRDGFVREDKVHSHFDARNIDAIENLMPLCGKVRKTEGQEQNFLLGYLVHILTDLFWNDTIDKIFVERYSCDPAPRQDRRMAYYNDTDQLDFLFYKRENWRPTVWELLEQATAYAVENAVSEGEVLAWNRRTLDWYLSGKSQHTNPIRYLEYEDLERFTDYAAAACSEYLAKQGELI